MQLRLKYPPTPQNAGALADLIVHAAREVSQVNLDYSPASLREVDQIIEGFRQDGVHLEQITETLFSFGCYVGEVFVRHAGGRWKEASETSFGQITDDALVVQIGPEDFCNPIGKVFKCFENGLEDSLEYFYAVLGRKS